LRHYEYLLKMKVGSAERSTKWNGQDPISLDHPIGWVLEPTETGFRVYDGTEKDKNLRSQSSVVVDEGSWQDHMHIELPASSYGNQKRNMSVDLVRLYPLQPAYSASTPTASAANKPRQLFMFYGLRYFMVHYRPIGRRHVATVGGNKIFSYEKTSEGYKITPIRESIKLKVPGERKRTLNVGQSYVIPEETFFNSTILMSVHWWRFQSVPTPDGLPPIETEETLDDEREAERLRKAIHAFIVSFILLTIGMFVMSKKERKIIAQTKVELKQPKIIPVKEPPKIVEKKPEPPKPPEKKPEKKVAEKKPTPQPKEKPKKVAKIPKPPKPKKVAQKAVAPNPKPVAKAPPRPPPTPKAKLPPAPGIIAKAPTPVAPPPPDPNKQLAKSLSFLGTSSAKPMAQVPTNYKNTSNKKFDPKAVAVGGGSPNSQLESMMNVSTDTNIETKSSRTIAGNIKFGGKGGGKELNNVQGKVSSKDLYDPNAKFGSGFASGGLSVTGLGTVDESAIEKALSKFMSKFQYCYEKALLSNPSLGGNIVYKWTIETSGKTNNPKVVKSQMKDASLNACISDVLKQVPFPKPKGGTVDVTKTFTFSSATL